MTDTPGPIYRVVDVTGSGLLQIERAEWRDIDTALWGLRRARRGGRVAPRSCHVCERAIATGQWVYAPVGNQSYRGERIHDVCLDRQIARAKQRKESTR